ncbi:DNA (cytosine-5-)-methyltransferase [Enterococcus faecalis]|uniref:DNA (cytosine-5-)-methyltransferase n=1 Tax=Enterococcus faecalis TaxID=1351 RepID=UPI00192508EF|nr:DNA cytosine methyltransferase [Enterococcus faecalis]
MNLLRILDLFSGAGGLTEGFRQAPFDIIAHIEMDLDACFSLKTREAYYFLKEEQKLDIYQDYVANKISRSELYDFIPPEKLNSILNIEINYDSMEGIFNFIDSRLDNGPIDGIIGGPPCQAYSMIGRAQNNHKKNTDERIYLYKYYLEFLKKYRPKFFIFENVKGLLSFRDSNDNELFIQIKQEFLEHGYDLEEKIINSVLYGIPQKRERLFLVGIRNDIRTNDSFFKVLEEKQEDAITINELFRDLPSLKSGESSKQYTNAEPCEFVKNSIRDMQYDKSLSYHIARPHNKNDLSIYKIVLEGKMNGKNLKYSDIPEKFQTHSNKKSFLDRYKAIDGTSSCHTIVAHIAKDGHYYIHPDINQNRSISVREAARIQSFPDNFYFESSRTSAFKQIGNAVPPILSKKLSDTILQILQ